MVAADPRPADDDRLIRIGERLLATPEVVDLDEPFEPDWLPDDPFDRPPVLAAVLIGLVRRPEGLNILYTERSARLRAHSGQVAFPGGKIDPTDLGPADAAMREAHEEVAVDPREVRILGYMSNYFTGTNYLITPVVALIEPTRPFVPNPAEVVDVFEVPLRRLALAESYGTFSVQRGRRIHSTVQIDHEGHRIWGITANLTRRFADLALAGEGRW